MGTVSDNAGIKRFGKPHLYTLSHSGYHTYTATVRGDNIGRARNAAAGAWTDFHNYRTTFSAMGFDRFTSEVLSVHYTSDLF